MPRFVYPLPDLRHLACSQSVTISNSAALNIVIHVSSGVSEVSSSGHWCASCVLKDVKLYVNAGLLFSEPLLLAIRLANVYWTYSKAYRVTAFVDLTVRGEDDK